MLACVPSATLLGVEGRPVRVEVHVASGLPAFTVVGLPDTSCREARDRVRAAITSSGLEWPQRRITVNLAPSGVRKVGAGLDLAIAVGLLAAAETIPSEGLAHTAFVGELGLDGRLRPVPGIVSLVDALSAETIVVPAGCGAEARLIASGEIRAVATLADLVAALIGAAPWPEPPPTPTTQPHPSGPDLADVRGQAVARHALEVAAAGGHHLLMIGPPGSGKTMLAHRLPGLLPALDRQTAIEATRVHSAAGVQPGDLMRRPPFRAPHHGASAVAMVGGGTHLMRPGEISLAHGGVLFLDELGEFAPHVVDSLRQPIEEGVIRVTRAAASVTLPARFQLVGSMNPCPCGEGGPPGACRCTDRERARYRRRLSGPLVDRFDLRIDVARPTAGDLLGGEPGEGSEAVRARVEAARARARERGVEANARLGAPQADALAPLTPAAEQLVQVALSNGRLSARGLHRIRCVALTIADLHGRDAPLVSDDVSLALSLRADPVLVG